MKVKAIRESASVKLVVPCCDRLPSRAEQRRRTLMDAARKLFIERGFHATGMAQIAKESGIAIGQIYRDFASKEDIVAALVETDCTRLMNYGAIEDAVHRGDAEVARRWIGEFVQPSDDIDDARLFAEIIAESARNERIAAIFTTLQADLRRHLLDALALLAPGIALAQRRVLLGDAVMTMSLGLTHYQLIHPDLAVGPLTDAIRAVIAREVAALNATYVGEAESAAQSAY